jgi:hypothetical protein
VRIRRGRDCVYTGISVFLLRYLVSLPADLILWSKLSEASWRLTKITSSLWGIVRPVISIVLWIQVHTSRVYVPSMIVCPIRSLHNAVPAIWCLKTPGT